MSFVLYSPEAAATCSDNDLHASIIMWACMVQQCITRKTKAILGMCRLSTNYLPDAIIDMLDSSLLPPNKCFDTQFLTTADTVTMINHIVPACTRLQRMRSRTDLKALTARAIITVLCQDLGASVCMPSHLAPLVAAHTLVRAWDHHNRAALAVAQCLLGLTSEGPTMSGASWHKPFLEAVLLC